MKQSTRENPDFRMNDAGGAALIEEDAFYQPEVHPNFCEWPMDGGGNYICPREFTSFIRFNGDSYWMRVCAPHKNAAESSGAKVAPKCKTCGFRPALDVPDCYVCWASKRDAKRRAAR